MRFRFDELATLTDVDLGSSSWHAVDQSRIDMFAEATDDRQWIHVDRVRAQDGPFGGTIAHGYLTLSLLPSLLAEIFEVSDRRIGINYGVDKIRFVSPVRAGSRVCVSARLVEATPRSEDSVLVRIAVRVEVEGQERPALAGEVLSLAVGPNRGAQP